MKKLVCLFAVIALAAPLYAAEGDPNILIECFDEGGGVCRVEYTVLAEDGDPGLVRGFALDISLSDGATIQSVSDYATGAPGTNVPTGYSVFVGQIDFGTDPNNVDDWGTPVATTNTPYGTIPGANGMVVELASLYEDGVGTAPGTSGTLLKFTAIEGTGPTTVTITANALRGEIVMEDIQHAEIDAPGCTLTFDGPCFVQSATGPAITAQMITDWQTFGSPDCWCYANQCYGDADGQQEFDAGFFHVGPGDVAIMAGAWKVKEAPKGPGILSVPGGICADFDHAQEFDAGFFRVGPGDVAVMAANWKVKEPPKGPGMPGDCVTSPVAP